MVVFNFSAQNDFAREFFLLRLFLKQELLLGATKKIRRFNLTVEYFSKSYFRKCQYSSGRLGSVPSIYYLFLRDCV